MLTDIWGIAHNNVKIPDFIGQYVLLLPFHCRVVTHTILLCHRQCILAHIYPCHMPLGAMPFQGYRDTSATRTYIRYFQHGRTR